MSRVAHPAGPRHADVLPAEHPPAPPADVNGLDPAIWPRGARRAEGVLQLAGADVRDLAAEFGTPVYVLDEADFRSRCRDFREAFGDSATVFYAAKAFCCQAVLRWASEAGLGIDVCTGGELGVALAADVPPAMITFHGSNKLMAELEQAVAAGVGHIVVDSFAEIARLAYLAEERERQAQPGQAGPVPPVLVRVTTGVEAHTHEFVATAHDDQKFGFSLSSGAADEAVRRVLAAPGLHLAGLHSHIGSQIYDAAGFDVAAQRVLGLAARMLREHGARIDELNLGSALPTHQPTTRPTSRSSRRTCGRSSAAGARRPACPCPGSRSSPAGRSPARAPLPCTRSGRSRMWTGCAATSAWTAG